MKKGIRVYNLYPKLVGSMDKWIKHFDRIKEMNFDWIYINPVHAPGFSGSDYSVKDYYLYHPLYTVGEMDFDHLQDQKTIGDRLLKKVCEEAEKRGLKIMMDLIINHTAIDCELTKTHANWYKRKEDGSIQNPGALDGDVWVTWGDLADIDNYTSPDRDALWEYWLDMISYYTKLGIRGYRCDAAYHVPEDLWKFLTSNIKKEYKDAIFVAETLGCETPELITVAESGFDYVMNSFKWWNYKDEWFMRLYKEWAGKYPSLTFPENHDTPRYAQEVNGNKSLALGKYALCAYMCSSVATTIGFEYGFKRKIDVVMTRPDWWEEPNYDISKEITHINKIKMSYNVLQEDNIIDIIYLGNDSIFAFTKKSLNGKEKIFVVANIDGYSWHNLYIDNIYHLLESGNIFDISHGHRMEKIYEKLEYNLSPGEVKLFYSKI